jgi:long-subunit fatty acid transport protein
LPGNDRAIVSLGLGYSIAGVRADVGYQFVNALEREVVDTNNLPGIYKTKAHVIGINLGYGY